MLRFSVPTMACASCAKGVTRAIQAVDADARVEADLTEREVRVENEKVDEAALLDALRNAGYPAERKLAPVG